MSDYISEAHVAAIKKAVEEGELPLTKTVGIEMLNLENFKFKLNNKNGIVSIGEMIELKKFISSAISNVSHITHTLLYHDKKSPQYWGRVDEREDEETGKKFFLISINLEIFMEDVSESREVVPGYVVPDNYALAKKVAKEFEEAGNDVKGIFDNSFRDCAVWHVNSKKQAQKLVKFIDEAYVIPKLRQLMVIGNIKKIVYGENKFEYVFNKKRKQK